jgi:hypothetical protein
MSGTPLRAEPLPVRDVRHPVTRGTTARARCQTPRYAESIEDFERRNYLDPRDGKLKQRTYFRFREVSAMKGRTTGSDGWLQSGIKWIP